MDSLRRTDRGHLPGLTRAGHAARPRGRPHAIPGPTSARSTPRYSTSCAADTRIRLLVGRRSDPFFADGEGTLHGFAWTGHDDFAGHNVSTIALEVSADMLFAGPAIGAWASVSRRRGDGILEQVDRGGNPTINPFINRDGEKDLYNSRQPADDVANYLDPWSKVPENVGYPPGEAKAAALMFLPDILCYDRTKPIDDVYSYRFAWLTYGKIPPQGLKPHADLLTDFPYLGPPNP